MLKNVRRGWRIVALFTVIGVLFAVNAQSQDRARYRDFRLGSALSSVAALAKVSTSGAKTLHQRPMLIQELEWRQAVRLDEHNAPQRDADRKQQEAEDTRTAQEKARLANKATFKP